jgi:hypothetical protein
MRAFAKVGPAATAAQISRFLGVPRRTVERTIAVLIAQGFLSNIRQLGFSKPMLRQLHPEQLGGHGRECGGHGGRECGGLKAPGRNSPKRKPPKKKPSLVEVGSSSSIKLVHAAGQKKADDDARVNETPMPPPTPKRKESYLIQARRILLLRGEAHQDVIDIVLREIESRGRQIPNSANYYLVAFKNYFLDEDTESDTAARAAEETFESTQPKFEDREPEQQQWKPTHDEVEELLMWRGPQSRKERDDAVRMENRVYREMARYRNQTGEFRNPDRRREWFEEIRRLKVRKEVDDAAKTRKRERANARRRERYAANGAA